MVVVCKMMNKKISHWRCKPRYTHNYENIKGSEKMEGVEDVAARRR